MINVKTFHFVTSALLIAGNMYSQSPFIGEITPHEIQSKEDGFKKVTDPKLKAQAQQWMSAQQQPGFLENKGQMLDADGKTTPFILFKTEAPGVNMYVTEKGLSYMFIKPDTLPEKNSGREEEENNFDNFIERDLLKKLNEHVRYECLRIDMSLTGASIKKENVIAEGASAWTANYYTGQEAAEGILGVHTYKKITIKEIYPGIDWVLYNSDSKGFKYDFVVHPGANPKQIKLLYRSEKDLDIDTEGNINIRTHLGTLTENTPMCYMDKSRENIPAKFIRTFASGEQKEQESEISFSLDDHDNSKTLVIDPQLWWGTYFYDMTGGNGSSVNPVTVDCDANGYVYVSGQTAGSLPLMPWGSAYYSAAMKQLFIARFTNKGVLTWSTYYGAASNTTSPNFLTIDKANNIYITGATHAAIPTQAWGSAYYNPTYNPAGSFGIGADAIILRFSNTGTLIWATHFGGSNWDNGTSINIAPNGNIYIAGWTTSTDFPTKAWGAAYYDNTYNGADDAYIAGFDNAGQLLWSTYLGGSSDDWVTSLTTDPSGNIYITGPTGSGNFPTQSLGGAYNDNSYNGGKYDAYVAKFTATGQLQWSTFLGGSGAEAGRDTPGISLIGLDLNNNIYVTSSTTSVNFPTQTWGTAYYDGTLSGLFDMFITRFNSSCALTWSTYYGGSGIPTPPNAGVDEDELNMVCDEIEFDNCGNLYLAFRTESADITTYNPGCGSYCDSTWGGGYGWKHSEELPGDVIVTKFSSRTGHLLWATFIGSTGNDFRGALAVDPYNNLFVVGVFWEYASGTNTGLPFVNPGGGAFFNNRSFGAASFNGGYAQGYILKFIPDPPPSFTQSQVNAGSCLCNGTATVGISAACSVAPYNYIWSNGTQVVNTNSTSNTGGALCPGSYWVEVTDDVCNRDTAYFTITAPVGNLSATGTQTNVYCNGGSNGTATVFPTGGTSPYNYIWNNGKTGAGITGLTSGNYIVIIKDANGCTYQQSFIITQSTSLITNLSGFTQTSACKNTGTATISASGGTVSYAYNWGAAAGGQTGTTATGLGVGNYIVTVTDANGCTATQAVPVTAMAPLSYTVTPYSSTCGTGASVGAAATGGTAPYAFTFSTGKTITTSGSTGDGPLVTGTYTVTIADANGCSGIQTCSVTATAQNAATATFTQSPAGVVCVGSAVIFTNTGTTTGTYSWTISQNSTSIVSGTTTDFSYTFLTAGNYTVIHSVENASCYDNASTTIQVINCSASPTVTATGNTTCAGVCTSVTSTGSGGTAPYNYSWSNAATTQNINPCPVATTTYTVTLTDNTGATASSTAVVTVNPAVNLTVAPTNITCSGGANGTALANPGGGTSPYTYIWSNGQTLQTAIGLAAGNYTVTVTDTKGCTVTVTSNITSPTPLTGQFTKGSATCAGCGCKGWILVTANGGIGPYSYSWPSGYTNRYQNHLCPGTYNINIKDKNGCSININLIAP